MRCGKGRETRRKKGEGKREGKRQRERDSFSLSSLFIGFVHEGHQSFISFRSGSDGTGDGEGVVFLGVQAGFGVDESDVDLDGAEGAGTDDLVGPRALPGDVKLDVLASSVLHDE